MFNVGGGELLVIFLVALIVLGPAKLPDVARQVGGMMREVRRISSGFQDEMRAAMEDPVEAAARERGDRVVASAESPAPAGIGDELDEDEESRHPDDADDELEAPSGVGSSDEPDEVGPGAAPDAAAMSTAAAAGMYDVAPTAPKSTPNPYLAPVGTRAQPAEADESDEPGDAPPDGTAGADDPETGPDPFDRSDLPDGNRHDAESADRITDER